MTGSIFDTLLALLVIAAVGRLVLSLLPPGHVGSHRVRDLPTTWAASHMLGLATIEALLRWPRVLEIEIPDMLALVLVVVIALLRLATLPGAMVPGYSVPRARMGFVARGIWIWVAVLLVQEAADAVQGDHSWHEFLHEPDQPTPILVAAVSLAALYLLVDHGLGVARRAPLGRAFVVLLLAAATTTSRMFDSSGEVCTRTLFLGAGASFLIAFQRRADGRSLALCAIAFAASADMRLLSQAPTVCALVVCVWMAPSLMHGQALSWCAGAAAVLALPAQIEAVWFPPAHVASLHAALDSLVPVLRDPLVPQAQGVLLLLTLACLVLMLCGFAGGHRRLPSRPSRVDPPRRELAALCTLFAAAAAAEIVVLLIWNPAAPPATAPNPGTARTLFLTLTPIGALVIGLVLVRDERIDAGSAG